MNELLDRIEHALMAAVRRRVSRRRVRKRILLATALIAGLLVLASVAAAVSGVGPAARLFDADEAIPSFREPELGGRRALLHTGGEGAAGWDLLVYRSEPPRLMAGHVRPYCLALARGDARPIPRGGLDRPPKPSEVYGGSTECSYPPTLAARLKRRAIEFHGGPMAQPQAPAGTTPYYGLVLGGAERVTIQRGDEDPVTAQLSHAFRLEVPRLPPRVRRQIESPRQMRATAGLPKFVRVRAFMAALDTRRTPVRERTPVVTATATFASGSTRTARLGGQKVLPAPPAPQFEPHPGGAVTRLEGAAGDGPPWRAIGFKTRQGGVCAGSARAPAPPYRGDLTCSGGLGLVAVLARPGLISEQGTGLPDGKRPPGSYTIFGLVRANVRRVTFSGQGATVPARLSPPWATVRWDERELRSVVDARMRKRLERLPRSIRIRLFMAVVPPGVRGLRLRLELEDGRVVRP